jgi:U5 small nuclear ribonucleoprotein component
VEVEVEVPDDASDISGGGLGLEVGLEVVSHDSTNNSNNSNSNSNNNSNNNEIVLHEDKIHYPSAQQVYGDDVRTAVLDEDAMDLDVPLVEPLATKTNRASGPAADAVADAITLALDKTSYVYSDDYLTALFGNENTTRNRRGFAIVGHLHAGKTTFIDMLLEQTLRNKWDPTRSSKNSQDTGGGFPRYTDALETEQSRQMSLVSTPLTTIIPDTRGKSYVITMMDCPGHANFHDESVAALRAVDGAVIVVDAVEGIMMHTQMLVRHAISEGLPLTLLINKVDRLIIELKLPPRDCYYKLLHLIESINELVAQASHGRYPNLSPAKGNVAFAASQHGWCFTLPSFATLYLDHLCENGLGDNLGANDLAERLWGDAYLDTDTNTFHKSPSDCKTPGIQRTFCTLVLEPIYKLYAACLGEREQDVNKLLRRVGVLLHRDQLRASARVLLRVALSKFMATATLGFVDMVVRYLYVKHCCVCVMWTVFIELNLLAVCIVVPYLSPLASYFYHFSPPPPPPPSSLVRLRQLPQRARSLAVTQALKMES